VALCGRFCFDHAMGDGMTRAELIAAAKDAGFWGVDAWFEHHAEHFYNFAAAVQKAERERCAKVCESEGARVDASWVSCAAAIRKGGE
jgi:hypothetical protein